MYNAAPEARHRSKENKEPKNTLQNILHKLSATKTIVAGL